MSNEMKLLIALCDALGFDVEVEYTHDHEAHTKACVSYARMHPFPYRAEKSPDFPKPEDYKKPHKFKVIKKGA